MNEYVLLMIYALHVSAVNSQLVDHVEILSREPVEGDSTFGRVAEQKTRERRELSFERIPVVGPLADRHVRVLESLDVEQRGANDRE